MMTQNITLSSTPDLQKDPRILIIDDDPTIRDTLTEMITVLNYRVDWAETGEKGLKKYQASLAGPAPFDLVITDMTFPVGLNGMEILAEIRRVNPEAKVIVSTGFSSQYDLSQYEQSGFNGFLMKPFGLKALQQSIQGVLEGQPGTLAASYR